MGLCIIEDDEGTSSLQASFTRVVVFAPNPFETCDRDLPIQVSRHSDDPIRNMSLVSMPAQVWLEGLHKLTLGMETKSMSDGIYI
jgi:hypothetical protein